MDTRGIGDEDVVTAHLLLTDVAVLHAALTSLLEEWNLLDDDARAILRSMVARRAQRVDARIRRLSAATAPEVKAALERLLVVARLAAAAEPDPGARSGWKACLDATPADSLASDLAGLVQGGRVPI